MKIRSIILCIYLVSRMTSFAQQPISNQLTEVHGLPSMLVYDLFLDQKGKLWLGTEEGIYWYDGFEFHGISLPHARSTAVSGIVEAPSGEILFRNFSSQVFVLSNGKTKPLQLKTKNGIIQDFKEFTRSTNGQFYFLKDSVIYTTPNPVTDSASVIWDQKVAGAPVRWLHFVVNDTLFFSEKHIVDLGDQKIYPNPFKTRATGFFENQLLQFNYANSAYFYLGINDSMSIFKDQRKTIINHTYFESTESVWLCTRDGLSNLRKGKYRTWFSGEFVTDMLSDNDGNYWVSTLNNGIYRIPKREVYWFTGNEQILQNRHVTCVQWKDNNSFFVGTNDGKVYLSTTEGKTNLVFDSKFKEPIKQILFLNPDTLGMKNQPVWAFVGHSIYFLNAKFEMINHAINASKGLTKLEANNYLFTSGDECGHYDIQSNQKTIHRFRRGRAILVQNGTQFIGYDDSLMVKTPNSNWRAVSSEQGSIVCSALIGYRDTVWIATLNQGLLTYINGRVSAQSASKDIGRGIHMKYHRGRLYISTTKGLYSIQNGQLNITNISQQLGLPQGAVPYFDLNDSLLLIALRNGLIYCNLNKIENHLESHNLDRISMSTDLKNKYDYDENELTLGYDFWNYSSNNYKLFYRLDEGPWKDHPLFPTQITINTPLPGHHVLQMSLGNEPSDAHIWFSQAFRISPPYYATWWFRVLVGLIPLLLVAFYYSHRIKQQKIRSLQELRISKAEQARQLSQLTALRSQMNPHFLFNALNSIQDFILQNDKGAANRYLGKFADLIRNTLTLSSSELISLQDEINALENYLELEALRFNDQLAWKIEIANGLDLSYYRVPPLLIQPFVENALKHGLLHLEGSKSLWIRVSESHDLLCIEIEDNGIGIKASLSQKDKNKEHNSFALQANRSRIDLLNNLYSGKLNLEIISPSQHTIGTLIRIQLPNLRHS
ncbi:MAG: histidine kinase [Flavobacteriales bacterium]|nr:histidine kinase [Flavobacteriales bacterium]